MLESKWPGEREDGRKEIEGRSVWDLGSGLVRELRKGLKMESAELSGGLFHLCARMMFKFDWVCCLSGAPHRVNGKVSGHLLVGHTPVHFTDVDLHAYVVGNDGRAYTAISHIPQPAAQALLPLMPIGGLFGWLFALEKPGWENGFSLTGEEGHWSPLLWWPGTLGFQSVKEDSLVQCSRAPGV